MYFSTSSYSLCRVATVRSFASLAQNPHNRACRVEEAQEWRRGRGRLGKVFTCCIVTVRRACSAAFLTLCISPCTKPVCHLLPSASPAAVPHLPHGPSCPPQGTALCVTPRPSSAGVVLLMELSQEQDIRKHGGMIRCGGSLLPGCLLVLNKVLGTLVELVSQWCPYMTGSCGTRPGYHPSRAENHRIES